MHIVQTKIKIILFKMENHKILQKNIYIILINLYQNIAIDKKNNKKVILLEKINIKKNLLNLKVKIKLKYIMRKKLKTNKHK